MSEINIKKPTKKHFNNVFNLVKNSKVLDVNSEYLYLIQTLHFTDTCSVALDEDKVIGFVSGYTIPNQKDKLFIWQVAVDSNYRGQNIALKLIDFIIKNNKSIKYINTTVSPSNNSSIRVFEKLANSYTCPINKIDCFEANEFINAHEEEVLYEIGPIDTNK